MKTQAEQLAEWLEANANSAFPPNIEGYWRPALELPAEASGTQAGEDFFYWSQNKIWKFPFPVVYTPDGYDQRLFLILLEEMEKALSPKRRCIVDGLRTALLENLTVTPLIQEKSGNGRQVT